MANTLSLYPVIQASKDARVNLSAFLQLDEIKNSEGDKFDINQPYYLDRVCGGSNLNGAVAIKNSLERAGLDNYNAQAIVNRIGDLDRFVVTKADEARLGGFTWANTKPIFDKLMNAKSAQEVRNSLIEGLPFTFGISTSIRAQMPEKSTFDFLNDNDLETPSGSTLFSSSEIITMLGFNGQPTDITNGATTIGNSSIVGSNDTLMYRVFGMNMVEMESNIQSNGNFAITNLIQAYYGKALVLAEAIMKTSIMRNYYKALSEAKWADGTPCVPTYELKDLVNGITYSLKDVASSSEKMGEFLTKIIPAVLAPQNKFLETNQRSLSRIVAHTSMEGAFRKVIPTLSFNAGTGQAYAGNGIDFETMAKDKKLAFGGDIIPNLEADLRMLMIADPTDPSMDITDHNWSYMSIALAPTIMATYQGVGLANQIMVSKFSDPKVVFPKSAMFLK